MSELNIVEMIWNWAGIEVEEETEERKSVEKNTNIARKKPISEGESQQTRATWATITGWRMMEGEDKKRMWMKRVQQKVPILEVKEDAYSKR